MKLNQKGITLVELIVSIALISMVIMFLFRLLVDVRYGENNIDYDRENQQNRAVILKNIQTDFLERKLIGLTDKTNNDSEVVLEFTYQDQSSATLRIQEDNLVYTNSNGTEKWLLEKENENTKIDIHCITYHTSLKEDTNEGDFFYIKFVVPITANKTRKNFIDDLEFFYIGELNDLESTTNFPDFTTSSLGRYQTNAC